MTTPHPAAATAIAIIDELIATGTTDIVVCPGSRSVPLAYAAAAAEASGRVRVHVRTDERTAGFLALGLARQLGSCVPVIVTSGTAVANLLPAVVEAHHSGVGLMVLSANRPLHLVGSGANQTIAQQGIFGSHVAAAVSIDAGAATQIDDTTLRQVRSWIDRVVQAAAFGPVHVDVPLAPPLVPTAADLAALAQPTTPLTRITPAAAAAASTPAVVVDLTERVLVIAGDGAVIPPQLAEVPTVAEPTAAAPQRVVHPLAVRLLRAGEIGGVTIAPQHIIVLGRPTMHRDVLGLLADAPCPITVIADARGHFADENFTATTVCAAEALAVAGEVSPKWQEITAALSHLGAKAVQGRVAEFYAAEATQLPTGLIVAAVIADALEAGDTLVSGASQPIRDLSLTGLPRDGVRCVSNRGASGIDGVVSTAIGTALAVDAWRDEDGFPAITPPRVLALMGDLTFLHDSTGLAIGVDEPRPRNLTIVVVNDHGGAIFEALEPGAPEHRSYFERVVATGLETDCAALCAAHGVAHQLATVHDLPTLLAEALDPDPLTDFGQDGLRVIEVECQRAGRREEAAALVAAMVVDLGPDHPAPAGAGEGAVEPRRRGVDIPDIGGDTLGEAVEWPQ